MSEFKKLRAMKYKSKLKWARKPPTENNESKENIDKIIIDDDEKLFQKRDLESNWHRYEAKEDDTEDCSKDFSLISSAPISSGGYFQFKNDKIEGKAVENKAFHLDVNLLSRSITTIPFHTRCGINEEYFSEEEINNMIETAKTKVIKYNEYLDKLMEKENVQMVENVNMFNDVSVREPNVSKLEEQVKDIVLKVDKVDCVKLKDTFKSKEEANSAEDLEQWLDDILED